MLKILIIRGYAGLKFSAWIGDRLFSYMVRVYVGKYIDGCKAVVKTSGVEFELLESLQLTNISEVELQTGEFTKGLRKVANLTIGGCEELTLSLKNEDRVLQHLISLDRLVIEGNSSLLEKMGKEAEELLQLQILTSKLKYLELYK
ncbi:hypothetical protein L3X38_009843 [Prunus dulcis]|uniref:Uncharacterized protein n=1 Tax=Prunus dulcis TaxID=3755 RepID=A0AAD4WFA9_PRUDU|nr:hypothetical protein L3X38_009843 [Prunus dulcis]